MILVYRFLSGRKESLRLSEFACHPFDKTEESTDTFCGRLKLAGDGCKRQKKKDQHCFSDGFPVDRSTGKTKKSGNLPLLKTSGFISVQRNIVIA